MNLLRLGVGNFPVSLSFMLYAIYPGTYWKGTAKKNDDRCNVLACVYIPRPYVNPVLVPEMQRLFVYRKCRRSRPGIWLLQLFDIFQPLNKTY